jgi:hypothetical protein
LWTPEKFRERLILMRDMMHQLGEHGLENPFADEAEPLLIGEVYYKLEALANLIDNPISQHIIGTTYGVHGRLDLNIIPCNPDGTFEDLDFIPDEPSDLIDQRIDFIVEITQAHELPEDLCRDVYVEYQFYLD